MPQITQRRGIAGRRDLKSDSFENKLKKLGGKVKDYIKSQQSQPPEGMSYLRGRLVKRIKKG